MLRTGLVIALLLAALTSGGAAEKTKEKPMNAPVVLPNVDRYRVTEPMFEGVRVILNARGEKYSPAYVQGTSGAAFRIAGPCPCAPTCEAKQWPGDLIKLFGYETESIGLGPEPAKSLPAMLDRIKTEVRAGRPVLVWNAFTYAEFDVVCGFDEEKHELLGRGSYGNMRGADYARAPENRVTACEGYPALGAITVGKKVKEFDARAAELDALRDAVAHAHGLSTTLPGMPSGLRCYDAWIQSYQKRGTLTQAKSRDEKQDLGWVKVLPPDDAYPLGIYASTHEAAAGFLKEIAPKYPEAAPYLELASEHFAKDAAALVAAGAVLGDRKSEPTEEQCARVASHLSEARAMYALAIDEIAAALRKIGGPKSNAGI